MRKVIFGAGKFGLELKEKLPEAIFCDNNEQVRKKYEGISSQELKDSDEVYISCYDVNGAYRDCIIYGCNPELVYIYRDKEIFSYKNYSIKYRNMDWLNPAWMKHWYIDEKETRKRVENFETTHNLKDNISGVAIMLSNICNYATVHKLCPASCAKEKEILSTATVTKILDDLQEINFRGTICFHIYNEPTNDPRLFMFIKMAKERGMKVHLLTNGFYLNQTMLDEYVELGVDYMSTTAYGKEEQIRLINLDIKTPYTVHFGILDERMDMYKDTDKSSNGFIKCEQLIKQISIYSNGDIGLCCVDYKHPYPLGNIYNESIIEILQKEKTINYQVDLLKGIREYTLCKNCFF